MAAKILHEIVSTWYFSAFIVVSPIAIIAASWYGKFFVQWMSGVRGRDWPTVSAVIDVATVERQVTGRANIVSYLATLTYFYRNPELQTGDYSRLFDGDHEADAQAWAASCKGRTVKVHVDPRAPSHSVLRKEEL